MQMGLCILGLQIHHDAPEGLTNACVQGGLVDGAVLIQQICEWNGLAGANTEPTSPIQIVFVVQSDGHQLNGLQFWMASRGPGQHLRQSPFQRAKRGKGVVIAFGENAHRRPRMHAVHTRIENDVVAFSKLVDAVALTVHRHLVVPPEDVPRHGIPKHVCPCQPMNLLRHKAGKRHRVHQSILVIADENGRGSWSRQALEVIHPADAEITRDASPDQDACQAVIQMGNLNGRMEDRT